MTPKEEIQAVIIRIQRARRHVGPARLAHAHFRKKCQDVETKFADSFQVPMLEKNLLMHVRSRISFNVKI